MLDERVHNGQNLKLNEKQIEHLNNIIELVISSYEGGLKNVDGQLGISF